MRDAFFASPDLPQLLKPASLRRTIADSVTQECWGTRKGRCRIGGRTVRQDLSELDVEVSDDAFICEIMTRELLEPPRVTRLAVRPSHANQSRQLSVHPKRSTSADRRSSRRVVGTGQCHRKRQGLLGRRGRGLLRVHVVADHLEARVDAGDFDCRQTTPPPSQAGTIAGVG